MCRGTTNMEDVYLINVEHIEHKEKLANPKWIEIHKGIPVDKCIGEEIQMFVNEGVITVGSCCGHGELKPTALVMEESRSILEKLGYTLIEYSDMHTEQGIYEIELKTVVN